VKFRLPCLTDLRNRGVHEVLFVVCDGLKTLPDAVITVWPPVVVQTCIIHLIHGSFRYASRTYWHELSQGPRPSNTGVSEAAAAEVDVLNDKLGTTYPAISRLWWSAWSGFIPFLDHDVEIASTKRMPAAETDLVTAP
jgi:transposase-like protein